MSADLAAWLLGCIAEDEATANDAAMRRGPEWCVEDPPPWRWGDDDQGATVLARGKPIADSGDYGGPLVVEHIARWDPAAVLAECAAKRAIVTHCSTMIELPNFDGPAEWIEGAPGGDSPVLRLLALGFASRPGYRDEWKPA